MLRHLIQRLALLLPLLLGALLPSQPARANDFAIMNGSAAADGAYPWFVSVISGNEICGGTLIHARWVLTAAHCFSPGQSARTVSVISNRRLLDNASTGQKIGATRFIQHADWNSTTFANDIALIELSQDAAATPLRLAPAALNLSNGTLLRGIGRGTLAPVASYLQDSYQLSSDCPSSLTACLTEARQKGHSDSDIITTLLLANGLGDPLQGIGYSQLLTELGKAGISLGSTPTISQIVSALEAKNYPLSQLAQIIDTAAGVTQEIREVDLPLVDAATCATTVSGLTSSMMCAGYRGTPKDTCQGDSGGPLVVRNAQDNDWRLLGITSYGDTCGTNYGVYTKASQFLDWIGGYVPNFNLDRIFTWGEEVAAPGLLRAAGNERSTTTYSPYWARMYPASGAALGYLSSNRNLYFYDGTTLQALGDYSTWLTQAKAAGY